VGDAERPLRIRDAARALIVDPDQRVLLVRFEFPDNGRRWALPGGGLEPGEDHVDALRRELVEEVGLHDVVIDQHIWTRLHIIAFFDGRWDGQRERIYLVATPAFEPSPTLSWHQLNDEYVFELRWWTLAEIVASDERFVPAALADHLGELFANGAPNPPLDIGV
jgi:8-oxo-dGTP diphosphatase